MPVVINEFEIAPAPPAPPAPPAEEPAPPPQEPPAQETERLLRRRAERQLRVWAH